MASVSGLSAEHRIEARDRACEAAVLTIRHAPEIHYTQSSPARMAGTLGHLNARKGQFPRTGDCSGMATWWLYNGLYIPFGVRDVVNGTGWHSGEGFTGTMLAHGKPVRHRENWRRGDLFIYNHLQRRQHVAMYLGDGYVASHGSEAGPFKLKWNYRSDLISVRRFI